MLLFHGLLDENNPNRTKSLIWLRQIEVFWEFSSNTHSQPAHNLIHWVLSNKKKVVQPERSENSAPVAREQVFWE
jgi:Cu2+-containing amine oxidase